MRIRHIIGVALLFISTCIYAQSISPSTKWHWDKGTIVVDTPTRPAGQQSALGLTTPKLETVRIGFAGLGSRGPWAVNRYCHIPGVQIVALCDYEEERARDAQKYLRKAGLKNSGWWAKLISWITVTCGISVRSVIQPSGERNRSGLILRRAFGSPHCSQSG